MTLYLLAFVALNLVVAVLAYGTNDHSTYSSFYVSVDDNLMAKEVQNNDKFLKTKLENSQVLCEGTLGKSKETGNWNTLWLITREKIDGSDLEKLEKVYYCLGFAEGALTYHEINQMFGNMFGDWFTDFEGSPKVQLIYEFLDENYQFMLGMSTKLRRKDVYWANVSLIISQLKGMYEGYLYGWHKEGTLFNLPLQFNDFLFLNADGDIQTLINSFKEREEKKKTGTSVQLSFDSQRELRCSALIKPITTNGKLDVLVGHTTWDHFEAMGPRILKTLNFGNLVERSFTMSSSPGMLSSVDDFFVTGSEMVVTETTNEVFNETLFLKVSPESLLSWVRARIANLERTPKDWAVTFSKFNSGTYNNQWMVMSAAMVLDDLTNGYDGTSGSFVVLEQLPDVIRYDFMLKNIVKQGYWASYNIPYFSEIWNLSNYSGRLPIDEFDHDECPRAKIFKRELVDIGEVNDLEAFKHIMRFNNYTTDPLSKGNACFGISSRCDLNEVTSPIYKASGGLDCKVVSLRNVIQGFGNLHFDAQMGPTNYDLPSFDWKKLEEKLSGNNIDIPTHIGQANVYSFDWIEYGTNPPPAADQTMLETRTVEN